MKNDLVALKSSDIDAWLPTHNDFLEVIITSKMEEGEFIDVINEIRDILEQDFIYEEDEEVEDEYEEDLLEESEPFYYERLKEEFSSMEDTNSNSLLYAGYADCMEEAIRFLIEEEKISSEHPIVENLKSHLEKSKDRILQNLSFENNNNNKGQETPLRDIFFETFQNCRDSG